MALSKISKEDLIFTNKLGDDKTNTYLKLDDYDWMNYVLTTRFRTEKMGTLSVKFEYFGTKISQMKVTQYFNGTSHEFVYEYPTIIFKKHIIKFLKKHIKSWNSKYAFNGEDKVVRFFNDVIEHGWLLVPKTIY